MLLLIEERIKVINKFLKETKLFVKILKNIS